ncbi:MAG: S8 family serine peptidase [Deltaproteobacteria bacterium]|nr:S8 family serine peptidase [Deltaproteobacteria bacterium]
MRRRRQMVRWVGGVGLAGLLATGCGTNAPDSASGPDEPLALTPNSALQELVPTEPELLEAIQTSPTPRTITFSVPLDPRQPAAGPRDQQQERAYRLKRPYRTTEVLVGRPSDALPFERVAVPIGTDVANALASLGAEPNYLTFLAGEPTNDPYFSWQWALAKIAAPEAWELFPASAPVRVAVLDTGVDAAHPDLFGRVLPGYNAINNTENADDDHGHGTMVAGVIGAGGNNGLGIAGVAPQVEILPIKVIAQSGEGSYADLIAGIYYAIEHGADVINISAGAYAPSNLLHDALTAAEVAGIVVVAAAGNDATDTPMYPAAYPEAMAVTATDATDAIWPESNYGTHVDLAAPGANIMSTMSGGGYAFADGTSLATAHVAGAAALLLSHAAAQTGADVVSRLLSSAIDLGAKGKDAAYGEGRLTLIPPTVGKPVADAGELPAGDAEEIGQGPITVQYNVEIHQDIASAALLFLKKKLEEKAITQEMYDEFAEYKFWIRDGARAEDKAVLIGKFAEKVIDFLFGEGAPWHDPKNGKGLDPLAWGDIAYEDVNCRWFRHFYRPIDKQGFLSPPAFVEWCGELDKSMVGKEHIEFPNAYEWGGKANAQNSFDWEDAKVHYHSPDTTQKYPGLIEQNGGFFFKLQPLKLQRAYYALGHVLHLLMDTSVPEHTHIEAHAEVNPGGYEHYMKKQGTGGVMSRLNTGLLLKPLNEYPTLEKYFHEMATYSFNRNLFQGNLTGDEASGELSQMFPSLHKTLAGWWVIAGWDDTTNFFCNPSSLCDLWWSGQGDGDGDDVDFDDDWWEETEFKDSPAPPGFYYIEKSNEVCPKMYHNTPKPGNNGDMVSGKCKDKTLAAMMADDIIPMVIQYTASAMRLFWHETHADLKIVPFSVNVLQTAVPAKGSNVANYQLKFTIRNDGGADSGNVFAGFRPPGSLLEFGTTMLPSIPPGGEAPVKIALNGIALPLCAPCAAGTIVAHYVHGSETQAVATHAIYGGDIKLPKTPGGVDFSKVDLTGLSVDPATGAIDFVLKGTPAGEGEASVDASALQEKLKATFLTALTIPNWKQFISLDLLPDGNGGFVGKARTEPPFEQTALANTMWTADVAMKLELFSAQHQKPNLDKWVSLVQGSPYWPQISAAGFNASPTYVARGTIVPGLSSPLQATIDQAFLDQAPLAVDIGWSQQPSINLSPYNFSQPVVENFQSLVTEWKGFFEAGMKDLAAVVLQKMSAGDPAYGDLAALYPAVLLAQWYKTLPKGSLPYADIINKEALADLDLVVPFNQSYWDGQAAQPLGSTNVSWFNGETWIFNYWGGAEFFVGFNGKTESLGQAEETLLTTVTGGEAVQQGDTWYFSGGSASQDQPDLAGMMSVTTALVVATKNAIIALTITNASNIAAGPVAYKILDQVTNGGAPITLAVAEGNLPGVGGWDGVSVEIPWSVPDLVGLHQLSLAIDPANAIAENNESNNMFQTMVAVISPLPKVAILAPSGGTLPKGEAILFSGSATTSRPANI